MVQSRIERMGALGDRERNDFVATTRKLPIVRGLIAYWSTLAVDTVTAIDGKAYDWRSAWQRSKKPVHLVQEMESKAPSITASGDLLFTSGCSMFCEDFGVQVRPKPTGYAMQLQLAVKQAPAMGADITQATYKGDRAVSDMYRSFAMSSGYGYGVRSSSRSLYDAPIGGMDVVAYSVDGDNNEIASLNGVPVTWGQNNFGGGRKVVDGIELLAGAGLEYEIRSVALFDSGKRLVQLEELNTYMQRI